MPYTLGTVHHLVGSGIVAVAAPLGLLARVTAAPARLSERFTTPATIFGLGVIRPGTADGWFVSTPLEAAETIAYPIADGATRVGFALGDGVSVDLVELVGTRPRDVLDRNPAPAVRSSLSWNPAGQPATSPWTYTVPAGRRLILTSARVSLLRLSALGNPGSGSGRGWFDLAGVSAFVDLYLSNATYWAESAMQGQMIIGPGGQIVANYSNSESSGGYYVEHSISGTLVDV